MCTEASNFVIEMFQIPVHFQLHVKECLRLKRANTDINVYFYNLKKKIEIRMQSK